MPLGNLGKAAVSWPWLGITEAEVHRDAGILDILVCWFLVFVFESSCLVSIVSIEVAYNNNILQRAQRDLKYSK
jgi:hypothetical protein